MDGRRGLTLIEIVIAILILSVGALALAGTSALMVRRLSESARGAAATSVARNRLESSHSLPCSALSSGSEQIFGVRSEWSTTGSTYSAAISQHVSYPTRRGAHTDHFLTAAPCR
jgi:prepilin-type N-terminal cleavage/methylation domain-containing protein